MLTLENKDTCMIFIHRSQDTVSQSHTGSTVCIYIPQGQLIIRTVGAFNVHLNVGRWFTIFTSSIPSFRQLYS